MSKYTLHLAKSRSFEANAIVLSMLFGLPAERLWNNRARKCKTFLLILKHKDNC
jgi:hypothetical protein